MDRYHCKPVRMLSYEGFQIFVFPHNLAKYLPGWDRSLQVPEKGETGMRCDGSQFSEITDL